MNRLITTLIPFARTSFFGLLMLVGLSGISGARAANADWRISMPVSISGGAYLQKNDAQSTTVDGIYSFAELRLSSNIRNYSLGVFYDYFASSVDSADGAQNLGVVHRFRVNSWDAANYVYGHKPTRGRRQWGFANRVRYRIVDNHKIGVEALGLFKNAEDPKVMLGYYGDISKTLSVKLAVGTALSDAAPKFAQIEFSWEAL